MPEQLTKHPEVTLQVLRSAGARCGEGAAQDILDRCPPERFCKLPGGEVCVLGIPQASRLTQFGAADWQALLPVVQAGAGQAMAPPSTPGAALLVGGTGMLIGMLVGVAATRLAGRRGQPSRR